MSKFFQSRFYVEYLSLCSTIFKTISRNLSNKKFEPEVAILNKFIEPGSICIDIGGAYGRYALPMSRIVGKMGKVYSFEPGRYSYRVLSFIKWFYELRNVVLTKKALSNQEGEIRLFSPLKKSGKVGPSLAFIDDKNHDDAVSELVPMTTLDVFFHQHNLSRVDLIKCDTEGAELNIYQGGRNLIEKFHPTVLSEVDDSNLKRFNQSVKNMEDFFFNRGYSILAFRNQTLQKVSHVAESGNYFFVHQSKLNKIL